MIPYPTNRQILTKMIKCYVVPMCHQIFAEKNTFQPKRLRIKFIIYFNNYYRNNQFS